MKLINAEIMRLWNEIYRINGLGLLDYLRDWATDCVRICGFSGDLYVEATQHGEEVFVKGHHYIFGTTCIFNRWDLWRECVSYYFDSFIEEQENVKAFEDITLEELKEYFIWKICRVMGIIDKLEEFLEVKPPKTAQEVHMLFM